MAYAHTRDANRIATRRDQDVYEELRKRGLSPDPHAEERARCAADVAYWIDTYCDTYDPRLPPEQRVCRMRLYPRQRDFLAWLEARERGRERGICEKSRGVGLTWLAVLFCMHRWLFVPGFSAGFGSRKLDLVDQLGDLDSILHKVRWELQRFASDPERHWLLPRGWDPRYAGYCRIVNPDSGAILSGEAGDQIGRGGRRSIYVVDEAAFLEHPEAIEGSLAETTDVRIDISTPNGPGGPFYQMRFGGTVPVFTFHWRDDPRRDHTWAEAKKAEIGPVRWASEYEIDYSASIEGICIPSAWARSCVRLPLQWADGEEYEPAGPIIAGWDVADGGMANHVVILRQGPRVLTVHSWRGEVEEGTGRAVRIAEEAGAKWLFYDAAGPGSVVPGILKRREAPLKVRVYGVNGGAPAPDRVLPDGRRASELYANLRAWLWYGVVRERCRRSYEYREWLKEAG